MSVYIDYPHLVESIIFDKFIYQNVISSKSSLILLCLLSGPFYSLIPLLVLFIRPLIPDIYIRRAIGWIIIIWSYFTGMLIWPSLFLMIETTREFVRFGIPYFLLNVKTTIPNDLFLLMVMVVFLILNEIQEFVLNLLMNRKL